MIRSITPVLVLALATSVVPVAATAQPSEGIVREGAGARRASLDAMELKPFPADLWGGVGAWANGAPLTSADTSGKPVIIVTWSNWYDASLRALTAAQRVADQYASDGLIVVGLHDDEEWDEAEGVAKSRGITFRIAHDTGNKMRAGLSVDQDPDIYVIDRAGQLRFADVDSSSLEQAAKIVAKETMEQAGKINQTLAEKAEEERIRANRTAAINQQADLVNIPELPFPDPSPEAYVNARWPKLPTDSGRQEQPGFFVLPSYGWYPPKPPATKGRAVVAYFWNPDVPSTSRMVKEMDLLQRERGRDIAVAGIVVPRETLSGGSSSFSDETKRALELELLGKRTKEFADSSRLAHPVMFDPTGAVMSSVSGRFTATQSPTYAVVASSDGMVRWYGDSKSPSFKAAVDAVIENDPGVKARRAAEQAWLKARGK
ncbi:MAG: TlpA family protein disulfide reductase [Phycisphaeraceae bacterium]|nr:TlpA family protein disulfide reductase [Phycisphaeraceae bacterium]